MRARADSVRRINTWEWRDETKATQRAVCVETAPAPGTPCTTTFELFIMRQPTPSAPRYLMSMRTKDKV